MVRTVYDNSEVVNVVVGTHQGSHLSHLIFVIFMEAVSSEVLVGLPWEPATCE